MGKKIGVMLVAWCLTVGLTGLAQGGVLFQDDFNRETLGSNYSGTGGMIDNGAWKQDIGKTYANVAQFGSDPYTIDFDVVQVAPTVEPYSFVDLQFSYNPSTGNYMHLYWANGTIQLSDNNEVRRERAQPGFDPQDGTHWQLDIDPASYTVVATFTNGSNVTSYTLSNSGNASYWAPGYIALEGSSWSSGLVIDNLVVSAVPEPATLSLVIMGAIGLLARRSRRTFI